MKKIILNAVLRNTIFNLKQSGKLINYTVEEIKKGKNADTEIALDFFEHAFKDYFEIKSRIEFGLRIIKSKGVR